MPEVIEQEIPQNAVSAKCQKVKYPEELIRAVLQSVFEFLSYNQDLPFNVTADWTRKKFTICKE